MYEILAESPPIRDLKQSRKTTDAENLKGMICVFINWTCTEFLSKPIMRTVGEKCISLGKVKK
jgi:hypothetical protein